MCLYYDTLVLLSAQFFLKIKEYLILYQNEFNFPVFNNEFYLVWYMNQINNY